MANIFELYQAYKVGHYVIVTLNPPCDVSHEVFEASGHRNKLIFIYKCELTITIKPVKDSFVLLGLEVSLGGTL